MPVATVAIIESNTLLLFAKIYDVTLYVYINEEQLDGT